MQFQKKTRPGSLSSITKLLLKLILLLAVIFGVVVILDKINFPTPIKDIEKQIPNEKFKVIK